MNGSPPNRQRSADSSTLSVCPPLIMVPQPAFSRHIRAADSISSKVWIGIPVISSASMRFGVMTAARGSRRVIMVSMASSRSRREPLVETMTGSTIRVPFQPSSESSTVSMSSLENSIPVLIARTSNSERTARICPRRESGVTGMMPETPSGFCSVRAVIAEQPKTPIAANVRKSA